MYVRETGDEPITVQRTSSARMLKNAAPSPRAQAAKTSWISFLFSAAPILSSFCLSLYFFSLHKLLIYLRPAVGKQVPFVFERGNLLQIDSGSHQLIAFCLRLC